MPQDLKWTRLTNSGNVHASPRAGHTITPTSAGFILFGGMDGRRNDQGNPSPNNDIYRLILGPKGTYEWQVIELDPASHTPPSRTLHTATPISSDELFLFGGIYSTTPYQVLNDGWVLDTTCFEWKRIMFKTSVTDYKGTYFKRMTGRITDRKQPEFTNRRTSNRGVNSVQGATQTRQSSNHISFESLAMAATRAVNDRQSILARRSSSRTADEGSFESGGGTHKKMWKRIVQKKMVTGTQKQQRGMRMRKRVLNYATLMTTEEEQFHDDLLSMVTTCQLNNDEDTKGGSVHLPAPRANHTVSLCEHMAVLVGGHGGIGYQRRAFNDVWVLNLDNDRWTELICHGNPPAPRSGHAAFTKEGCVFIFGGWNSETQFNDLFMLDVENKDWSDLDLGWSVPRWNMAVQLVEAIPSWRVFIFGGSVDKLSEGRSMGTFDRRMGVLELAEERKWDTPVLEDEKKGEKLPGREHTAICYDREESRLILYGGWANKWMDDVWQINVSSIVGPPYAIARVEPPLGPVTGNQKVLVHGVGFLSAPGSCTIRFSTGNGKYSVETQGTIIDDELIECRTPNAVNSIGPRECEVRLAIGVKDFTTTVTDYLYYLNTVAESSLCYGPGLLEQQQADMATRFMIQAKNQFGENRNSGRDDFVINIQQKVVNPEGKDTLREIPFELRDLDNGQYEVTYTMTVGEAIVHVKLVDENGKPRPVRGSPFRPSFIAQAKHRANEYTGSNVSSWLMHTQKALEEFYTITNVGQSMKLKEGDVKGLIKVINHIKDMYHQEPDLIRKQDEIFETLAHLDREGLPNDKQLKKLKQVGANLVTLKGQCQQTEKSIQPMVLQQSELYRKKIAAFEQELRVYHGGLKKESYYYYSSGVELALKTMDQVTSHLDGKTQEMEDLMHIARNFEYPDELNASGKVMMQMREDVANVRTLWEHEIERIKLTERFLVMRWGDISVPDMEDEVKASFKQLKEVKVDKRCDAYFGIQEVFKRWIVFMPLVGELHDPAMRPRHWSTLMQLCGKNVTVTDDILLRDMWNMELHKFPSDVEDIGEQAKQESKMESTLGKLAKIWAGIEFTFEPHKGTDVMLMRIREEDIETLEENQVQVQNMFASRFLATFESQVVSWQKTLANISETSMLLAEVQRTWDFLENLFIHSEEVKKELPDESERFLEIDDDVKDILKFGQKMNNAKDFCNYHGIYQTLEKVQTHLTMCEKALHEFMDGKRRAFSRFYFMSGANLLDVLSNGNNPARVVPQFPKFFNAIEKYDLEYPDGPNKRPVATGMHACIGKEYIPFPEHLPLLGKVEIYLERCIEAFREALQYFVKKDLTDYATQGCASSGIARGEWLLNVKAAQCALLVQLITWVRLVEGAFARGEDSDDEGVQKQVCDARDQQHELLLALIRLTMTNLDQSSRQKVMCAITLDAHNRDVQSRLVEEKVMNREAFQWQSMLKSYWDEEEEDASMQICDARFWYGYEYLGNGPRLVVTPLTDRIYVTATQALHLHMGCAPAGPAGTGKTESTKDLANALARACYVINAAPEMDFVTMGNIFKGLAASGSWGCFDEFNRLVPEVLSVCTVQFKSVCDALKNKAKRFVLQGDEINLDPSVGVFITMNPGYLGRSELPEGLKALFRPITVISPDFMLIMENMFMSEGFLEAKTLAVKFATLYALNRDLLSKSNKYDWGMRAIKSVLVVAGGFKRADTSLSEQSVLMRSLRDTNVAKIEGDDLKIFVGLLNDLFPGVDVPRARDMEFEEVLVNVMETEYGYTNDPGGYLVLKITQLIDLLMIRHSVFLMGSPGSFKSSMWKVLKSAKTKVGDKTTVVDFSPKAISTNELYGSVNISSREWKDGILSKTMRDLGQIPDTFPKWILLDGDLDANWIESMNSVMDDSRLLTLPSNERIPLKVHMKMIFEIRDLNYATPATATRAGILCMSEKSGVQWRSYVSSWISKTSYSDPLKETLQKLFEKYCPETFTWISKNTKVQVHMYDIAFAASLCGLLDGLVGQSQQESIEYWFVFCTVFAIGTCLSEIEGVDYRKQFSNWWKNEMKTVKYPSKGQVFDYFVKDLRFEEWLMTVEKIPYVSSETVMSEVTVPTAETVSMSYFMKALIEVHHPVMLIGLAGCGKTQQCSGLLKTLNPEAFTSYKINMSYYTDSTLLQTMLEIPLEKKAGRLYAPPGKLQMIYFIDDLNMPSLDKYNTQSAIELIKQKQDYSHWYDRHKIQLKDIGSTQYLCCMNPTAGSFTVNQRLQRHFWTCAVPAPEQSSLSVIYSTFMKGHFEVLPFKLQVQEMTSGIIKGALSLHLKVQANFRKTAKNMHYEFNIRHISGIFSGLLQAKPQEFADAEKLVLLWIHESERIYGDRLVSISDLKKYRLIAGELTKKMFSKFGLQKYFQEKSPEPLVFAPFAKGIAEMDSGGCYDKIKDVDSLSVLLGEALDKYNEYHAAMDLVLFEDAAKHVAKITRIISNPSGHPLLIGVGGSGRQSLSRLSAFICDCHPFMIVISSTYDMNDLKADLQFLYKKSGEKDEGMMFLFTDSQIADERFFVYFNDLLATGEITDLFPQEDKDLIRNSVRSACKSYGILDTPDNLWHFYISRVRKNLHMSLCFSPVGDGLWARARKFPALINCTVIDWFQPWPNDALHNVASRKLMSIDQLGAQDDPLRTSIVEFFPFSFDAVNHLSTKFILEERRYAYTTPKSFLELIKFYTLMLQKNVDGLEDKKTRLTNGLVKLRITEDQVSRLQEELKDKAVVVQEKAQKADVFAEEVGRETATVNAEAEKANIEAAKCTQINEQVSEKKAECEREVAAAIPLVEQAENALNVLDKKEFNELKAFKAPPPGVDIVCEAAMHLQATIDPNIECDKRGKVRDRTWKGCQKMMQDPNKFLENLKSYKSQIDAGRVPAQNVEEARRLKDHLGSDFSPDIMRKKSQAAGGLCEWVTNIIMYYDVIVTVEPKKQMLKDSTRNLELAQERMQEMQLIVQDLEERLGKLKAEYEQAIAEKDAMQQDAERCQTKLDMAVRLVGALSANGVIWTQAVETAGQELVYIPGDSLVACSFASYVGVFTRQYRENAVEQFVNFIREKEVPLGPSPDPLEVLSSQAEQAKWCSKGLMSDRVSLENGAIMTNSERWPLVIDPQSQGIVWIKNKEAENNLQVTRMGHSKMVHVFEQCIEHGKSILIENMSEEIDAVLQPVVARQTISRGSKRMMKLGEKEIPLNKYFKLFMHTKLSNPHYAPDIHAECTLINFTVTEQGLEDQLLFLIVKLERPDLARTKSELILQQNEFKIRLADLEALLLEKLATAEGDILDDVDLIRGLEEAKKTAEEVKDKVNKAQETAAKINETSEHYRIAAERGSLLFFLMMDLCKMHTFYRYSLDAFVVVVTRAINSISLRKKQDDPASPGGAKRETQLARPSAVADGLKGDAQPAEKPSEGAEDASSPKRGGEDRHLERGKTGDQDFPDEEAAGSDDEEIIDLSGKELAKRVQILQTTITLFVFQYVRRGLLDADKLTVASMLTLRILVRSNIVTEQELNILIRAPPDPNTPPMPENTRSWLSDLQWAQLKSLEQIAMFKSATNALTQAIEQDSLGWKRFHGEERAETADLPRSCRELQTFHRLFLLRVLRPDRLGSALTQFVIDNLGSEFVEQPPFDMAQTYEESSCITPFFFVLFPGTDPTPMVEALGAGMGMSELNGRLVNISMGQGQEMVAINALQKAAREGGWVMLQNIHLMQPWLKQLERTLEIIEENSHPDFRCYLTSEPPSVLQGPLWELLPEAILQKCIKIADEAPTDLKSNLRRAYAKFSQEHIEACLKPKEFKATLFALCFFHALILGRIKFGPQGWSRKYPFNDGDLTICAQVLCNYLNNSEKLGTEVPWADLRYLIGDIMYGGHITDHWDRRVCRTYLQTLILPELLANLTLAPGFKSPDASKMEYFGYQKFMEERFPPEQPQLFSLHPNAEIGFLTNQGISIFKTVQSVSGGSTGAAHLDISSSAPVITNYLDRLPLDLDMLTIRGLLRDEDYTPYTITSLQESDRMNLLLQEIRSSLVELELGISGQLNITEGMERLSEALQLNRVNPSWRKLAYPSLKPLAPWFADLVRRHEQLTAWTSGKTLLKSIWLPGLFNPMAFLTAVMQVTARASSLPLDYMTNRTTFLNTKDPGDLTGQPPSGVHVHGLFMEGASWEEGKGDDEGYISDSKMKELHPVMPIANVFSVPLEQMSWESMYCCPIFITSERGDTFIVSMNVRMDPDDDEKRWILLGAALLLTDD